METTSLMKIVIKLILIVFSLLSFSIVNAQSKAYFDDELIYESWDNGKVSQKDLRRPNVHGKISLYDLYNPGEGFEKLQVLGELMDSTYETSSSFKTYQFIYKGIKLVYYNTAGTPDLAEFTMTGSNMYVSIRGEKVKIGDPISLHVELFARSKKSSSDVMGYSCYEITKDDSTDTIKTIHYQVITQ